MVFDRSWYICIELIDTRVMSTETNGLELSREARSRNWCVYILRCKDSSLYIGVSSDPESRLRKHNAGQGAMWVRDHGTAHLVYVESAPSYKSARVRVRQIKKWSRIKKEQLISRMVRRGEVPEWPNGAVC